MADESSETLEARVLRLEDTARLTHDLVRVLLVHSGWRAIRAAQPWPLLAAHQLTPLTDSADRQTEVKVDGYAHLVYRPFSGREQLYLRGRNQTARQVVGVLMANKMSPEAVAEDLGLPVEAVNEAVAYCKKNVALLELESAYERYLLAQQEEPCGAQPATR